MRVGGGRWLAVALSVAVGVAAGALAAGLATEEPEELDPLALETSLVNLDCDLDTSILLVERGPASPALHAAVVEAKNRGESVHYLRTADSCDTSYAAEGEPTPEYAVYVGPFDTLAEACRLRMSEAHKGGDVVTRLREGNTMFVKCACELPTADLPVLDPAAVPSVVDRMWTAQLQSMLVDLGKLEDAVDETGVLDARTVAVIRRMQAFVGYAPSGVVDAAVWRVVVGRACGRYDY